MDEIILVAGATGNLGQRIVSKLLLQNRHVRALVRDLEKGRALLGENLELAQGDTRWIDTVFEATEGVHAVICATGTRNTESDNAPEQVDFEGIRNLVQAAAQNNVQHFILVSSLAVTRPDHPLNQGGSVLDWKRQGEDALRASSLSYTIVRPGGLTDEPGGAKALQIDQGDRISGRISRDDLAEICVQALDEESLRGATFEVVEAEGQPPQSPDEWTALFGSLKPDAEWGRHG